MGLPDIYKYPPGFPPENVISEPSPDGGRDIYKVLVGVKRFIAHLAPGAGFVLPDHEILNLRLKRSDLGAHYARIFQRAGRPVEVAKEAEVTP